MKADLFFYTNFCGGEEKIPAAEFPLWEARAGEALSYITDGKSADCDSDKVKACICAMAELMYEEAKRNGIASENNDGYSVVYKSEDMQGKLCAIAKTRLFGTDLLYRGVIK